jgi:ribosome biogenesis GTPase / thiamine phosphate phosphatase
MNRRRKKPREQNLTGQFLRGELEEQQPEQSQRFSARSKNAEHNKILRTVLMRAEEEGDDSDIDSLPLGQVVQVYSLFSDVEHEGQIYLCVARKTLTRVSETQMVVGDYVRFRPTGSTDESGRPEAVIERVLPRRTVLTRTDSFDSRQQDPIVANAEQMLIVTSIAEPRVKWGLVDRMLIAAQGGGLAAVVCLNKVDLGGEGGDKETRRQGGKETKRQKGKGTRGQGGKETEEGEKLGRVLEEARGVLAHYASLGARVLETSVIREIGIDELRETLRGKVTVLAGHSGVGKSSLIRAVQPSLDLRVGAVSRYTEKGRHTTTSARRYPLEVGGQVIDTPGVKLFGLWGVTAENLDQFFPDVAGGTAPQWRVESYERIRESLKGEA